MEKNIIVLSFIVFFVVGIFMYSDIFGILYERNIHPLLNSFNRPNKYKEKLIVWIYLEEPSFLNKDIDIELLNRHKNFTTLFKMCLKIMDRSINKKYYAFHVITPENVKEYLPDFPIKMNADSKYPLKFRVDLLASMILSKNGGLFLSPATLVMKNLDEILYKLTFNYDLITFGGSVNVVNSCDDKYNPSNYVIAAKKGNKVINLYKERMLSHYKTYNFKESTGEVVFSDVLHELKPEKHYHFDCSYTGYTDVNNNLIPLKEYYGFMPIQFKDKNSLIFISLPYDTILENIQYQWFNNLSEDQFFNSKIQLTKIIYNRLNNLNLIQKVE